MVSLVRFGAGGVGIGFLGILRAGDIEFRAGEYVGDGGRGSPLTTLVSNLGDICNPRELKGRPRGPELEIDDAVDCGKSGGARNCREPLPPARSLSSRAVKSSTVGTLLASGPRGLEELILGGAPLTLPSITS